MVRTHARLIFACAWLSCASCDEQAASDASSGRGGAAGEAGAPAGAAGDESGSGGSTRGAATACADAPAFFATGSPEHSFGTGQDVGQADFPQPVLGPPHGGSSESGSADVVSLGEEGSVTLEFSGNYIVDDEGADFIVFENAFYVGGDEEKPFAELADVAVSQDGKTWLTFPCEAADFPYLNCAGWNPVLVAPGDGEDAARDPERAGGDPFDLAVLGLPWARYVRITDRADGGRTVFDLDAVAIVNAGCD